MMLGLAPFEDSFPYPPDREATPDEKAAYSLAQSQYQHMLALESGAPFDISLGPDYYGWVGDETSPTGYRNRFTGDTAFPWTLNPWAGSVDFGGGNFSPFILRPTFWRDEDHGGGFYIDTSGRAFASLAALNAANGSSWTEYSIARSSFSEKRGNDDSAGFIDHIMMGLAEVAVAYGAVEAVVVGGVDAVAASSTSAGEAGGGGVVVEGGAAAAAGGEVATSVDTTASLEAAGDAGAAEYGTGEAVTSADFGSSGSAAAAAGGESASVDDVVSWAKKIYSGAQTLYKLSQQAQGKQAPPQSTSSAPRQSGNVFVVAGDESTGGVGADYSPVVKKLAVPALLLVASLLTPGG